MVGNRSVIASGRGGGDLDLLPFVSPLAALGHIFYSEVYQVPRELAAQNLHRLL